jgi:hypothetical protein
VRTIRVVTSTLVLISLMGAAAVCVLADTAGAAEPQSIVRCEADFLGFMVLSDADTIHAGCEDLGPAYQAGVAAYQQRNAECAGIDGLAHPIKRTRCEIGAKKDGLNAFRAAAKAIRAAAPPSTTALAAVAAAPAAVAPAAVASAPATGASATTPTTAQTGNTVTRFVKNHPAAATALAVGGATLAFAPARAVAIGAGSMVTGVLGKLVTVVKAPFAAAARIIG